LKGELNSKIECGGALLNFLSYFFTFKTAWVISKPRWRMDGRWDRIFITFNDLADSTADTHRVLMTCDTCRVAWACCIVTHVPRATCMQTRILRPLLCKISVGRRRGKKVHGRFFDHCFEWRIPICVRADCSFLPLRVLGPSSLMKCLRTYAVKHHLLFLSSVENIRPSTTAIEIIISSNNGIVPWTIFYSVKLKEVCHSAL